MPEIHTVQRRLARDMARCIADFDLIEEGDRVMVCLSGGKDSYTMLQLLDRARTRAPVGFELVAVHLDQGQPGYNGEPLRRWLDGFGCEYKLLSKDTYSVVVDRVPEGKTYCGLCSRLRRGILYNAAQDLGCTKIALGHHRDDTIETALMNMMFNGTLSAMPARLQSDDGRNTVIRPLLYCAEQDIAAFAEAKAFPILPCNLCGSQQHLWRAQVKELLSQLEQRIPQVRGSMLGALKNVHASHLLDPTLLRSADPLAPMPVSTDGHTELGDERDAMKLPLLG